MQILREEITELEEVRLRALFGSFTACACALSMAVKSMNSYDIHLILAWIFTIAVFVIKELQANWVFWFV